MVGTKGQAKDGMFKVVLGRPASMHATTVGKEMGVNTWAAFAGSDDAAVVDGDFAMTEPELQPVLKAMRHNGINVVAIHQHMTGEEPRILFLHYWGKGKATDLARSVRLALDAQTALAHLCNFCCWPIADIAAACILVGCRVKSGPSLSGSGLTADLKPAPLSPWPSRALLRA